MRESKVTSMKLSIGSIRRRGTTGIYAYRYQVNGRRIEISLQTRDYGEAMKKAAELAPIAEARTAEVVAAHVNAAKGFARQSSDLQLADAWQTYSRHPDRALPFTVHERLSYQSSFAEFVAFATRGSTPEEKARHAVRMPISLMREVTPAIAESFADYLRTTPISVSTHNRKLKRVRKVFEVLKDYCGGAANPFRAKSLMRSTREEQGLGVRRQAFTRAEEARLLEELRSSAHRLKNRDEIRIIYTIGMYTGQRLKDCVLLQWQNVDLEHRRIFVKQFKTGKEVTIPLAPQLYAALLEARDWKTDHFVCPKTAERYCKNDARGKNIGSNLVNHDVLRVIRWIGLESSVSVPGRKRKMTVYGFHSLRHSFASFCAEAGVPKAVLLSILGTDSAIADKYYTHVGNEAQERAIAAISGTAPEAPKRSREIIAEVLKYIDARPRPLSAEVDQIRAQLLGV